MSKSLVIIKATRGLQTIEQVKSHVKYVGFRSKEIEQKGFFDREKDNADHKDFIERISNNSALQHKQSIKAQKVIFSLRQTDYEAYKRSGKDFKDLVRHTLGEYEKKNNVKLDWIANIHESEGHPHCHVVIKGVSDIKGDRGYKRIRFDKETFKDMKDDFNKEFNKDVRYKFFERDEVKDAIKDTAKGIEQFAKSIQREAEKQQEKGKVERDSDVKKEQIEKEKEKKRDRGR